MGKRVAILQSSYVPWRGYFDLIRSVDHFVLYDEVQYTRRDWRNRNRVLTSQGVRWLTVPVKVKGRFEQRIDETELDGTAWASKHWRTLEHAYRGSRHWDSVEEKLRGALVEDVPSRLSALNRRLLETICDLLEIDTPISWSTDHASQPGRNERLISLCGEIGASVYVSGPSARSYIEEDRFAAADLRVEWFDYPSYAPYPQVHGGWEPNLSVLDLLFNCGPSAALELSRAETEVTA